MLEHSFGGSWTTDKLERVRQYLEKYMQILRKHPSLEPIYLDAFAGTGYRERPGVVDADQLPIIEFDAAETRFLKGSAPIALGIAHPFSRYIFIERNKKRVDELRRLKVTYESLADRIDIVQEDANAFMQRWCEETDWRSTRAAVFLDPYGMQVEWPTVECLANTGAVDLWYLFSLSAVNRLLPKNGIPRPAWVERLNRIYGTNQWRDAFCPRRTVADLFGEQETGSKDADFTTIANFTNDRLRSVFAAVAPNPLVLRNEKNSPLFLLCFAVASHKESVQRAALNIATHILKM